MRRQHTSATDDDLRTASLAGLAVVLVILIVSLGVVRKLQVRVLLETCMQTQSTGCEQAVDRLRVSRIWAGLLQPK
jgi:hypothetical protein